MEKTPFLGAENELQKIYSNLGVMVPVGDLDNGKAPAIQPLPATSTTTSITAKFNVMSGADISSLSYKVNDGDAVSLTPAKGVVTITIEDLEYNSGPYEIELTATNETGSTVTSSTVALQPYTDWATADEVLEGNKFIGEDGQEAVGTYVAPDPVLSSIEFQSNGEYYASDYELDGFSSVLVNVNNNDNSANGICSQQFENALGYLFTGKIYSKTEGGAGIQDVIDVYDIELYDAEVGPTILCNGFSAPVYNSSENCITFGFSTNEMPANRGIISGTGRVAFVSNTTFPDEQQYQYVAYFNWTCDTGQSLYNLSNAVLTETAQGEYSFEMDSDSDMTDYEFTVFLYNTDGVNTLYVNMVPDPNNAYHLITDPNILPLTTQDNVGEGGVVEIQSVYNNGVEIGPNPWPQYSVTPLT